MLGGGYDESEEKGPGDIEEKILIAPRGGASEPSAPDKGELDNLEEEKRKESSNQLKFFSEEDLDVNDSSGSKVLE